MELARALTALGHRVRVLTLDGSLDVHERNHIDHRIPVMQIGRRHVASWIERLHPKLGQAWNMIRLGLAGRHVCRADILMSHHYPAQWASFVATMFRRAPVVWLCNDWIYHPLAPGHRLGRLARLALRAAMVALDGFIARRCSAVLVLSRLTGHAVDRGYRVNSRVFRTGATGPDSWPTGGDRRARARRILAISSDVYLLSTVCILMPHRRVEDVIRALARLAEGLRGRVQFIHVGASPDQRLRDSLQALASQEGVAERVSFLGAVSETVRRQIIDASDVFLFPVERQSWGLAPLEAMAARIPTIVSGASGVSEVLRDGRDALVYKAGDANRLAQLITWLHDRPDDAAALAEAGRRRWERRFTWSRAARRLARHLSRYQPS